MTAETDELAGANGRTVRGKPFEFEAEPQHRAEPSLDGIELDYRDCGAKFVFTAGEQDFFKSKGFTSPIRCRTYREKRKAQNGVL